MASNAATAFFSAFSAAVDSLFSRAGFLHVGVALGSYARDLTEQTDPCLGLRPRTTENGLRTQLPLEVRRRLHRGVRSLRRLLDRSSALGDAPAHLVLFRRQGVELPGFGDPRDRFGRAPCLGHGFLRVRLGRGDGFLELLLLWDGRCERRSPSRLLFRGSLRFLDPLGSVFRDPPSLALDTTELEVDRSDAVLRRPAEVIDLFEAEHAFEDLHPFARRRVQEARELPLGQEHRRTERVEIEAKELLDVSRHGLGSDGLVPGRHVDQDVLPRSVARERAGDLVAGVVDPEPQPHLRRLRARADEAFHPGLHPRCLAVESERDPIQDRRLPGAGWTYDGDEVPPAQVELGAPLVRAEPLEHEGVRPHSDTPTSSTSSVRAVTRSSSGSV